MWKLGGGDSDSRGKGRWVSGGNTGVGVGVGWCGLNNANTPQVKAISLSLFPLSYFLM